MPQDVLKTVQDAPSAAQVASKTAQDYGKDGSMNYWKDGSNHPIKKYRDPVTSVSARFPTGVSSFPSPAFYPQTAFPVRTHKQILPTPLSITYWKEGPHHRIKKIKNPMTGVSSSPCPLCTCRPPSPSELTNKVRPPPIINYVLERRI